MLHTQLSLFSNQQALNSFPCTVYVHVKWGEEGGEDEDKEGKKNKRKQQVKFEIYTCKYTALNKLIPIAYSWILALFTEIVFF